MIYKQTIKAYLHKNKLLVIILAIIFIISIAFTYNYIDFSKNQSIGVGYAYTAKSIALSHNINVDEYWGNAGADVFKFNNHWYTPYPPLNSIIMGTFYFLSQIPIYIFIHLIGPLNGDFSILYESFVLSLPHTLSLIIIGALIYKNLEKIKIKRYLKYVLIVGSLLGTILFPYSVSFFNHIIASLFILLAYTALIGKEETRKKYWLTGIYIGLAFLTEYPTILFSISVLIYTIIKYIEKSTITSIKDYFNKYLKRLAYLSIPILISIGIQLILNKMMFGNYFLFSERVFHSVKSQQDIYVASFSQNPLFGIYGMYFSPLKGLFVYSPFLLISILGLREFYRKNRIKFYTAISYVTIITLLYSTWSDCFGASTIGTRYMITIIPFISILTGYGLSKIQKNIFLKIIFTILLLYSMVTTILITQTGIASGKIGQCKNINKWGIWFKLEKPTL